MPYRPNLGDADGGPRDPFTTFTETEEIAEDSDHRRKPLTFWSLTGLLWNCPDVRVRRTRLAAGSHVRPGLCGRACAVGDGHRLPRIS
jgi:hypothetical protein